MGDLSTEPSMEEILSSIKRIIAEEGDGAPQRGRRPVRGPLPAALTPMSADDDDDEVLELSDPMPASRPPMPEPQAQPMPQSIEPRQQRVVAPPASTPQPAAETVKPERIVSPEAAAASRGALDMLGRLMVKPEPGSDGTMEGLIRELLRPMLREWLDANLPELVEAMVAREIKRITGAA